MDLDVLKDDFDRLIRYGYSGFLLTGILLFLMPGGVRPAIEAGGAVVAPLAILAAGAAVYTLYRYALNELFLAPFVLHPLHSLIDRRKREPTNPANFLARLGVPRHLRHPAYVELRRSFFHDDQRRSFNRNHTEATIVWITAVECSFSGAALMLLPVPGVSSWKSWLLLAAGVLTLVAAIIMDIRLFNRSVALYKGSRRV